MAGKGDPNLIAARRERVAQLKVRGLTNREIVAGLDKQGFHNPKTQAPFSLGTIGTDIRELHKQWVASAAKSIADHKADQLAETTEVKHAAWAAKKLDTILRALEREAKLLGLDMPTRIDVRDMDAAINAELARLASGSESKIPGQAESTAVIESSKGV